MGMTVYLSQSSSYAVNQFVRQVSLVTEKGKYTSYLQNGQEESRRKL